MVAVHPGAVPECPDSLSAAASFGIVLDASVSAKRGISLNTTMATANLALYGSTPIANSARLSLDATLTTEDHETPMDWWAKCTKAVSPSTVDQLPALSLRNGRLGEVSLQVTYCHHFADEIMSHLHSGVCCHDLVRTSLVARRCASRIGLAYFAAVSN